MPGNHQTQREAEQSFFKKKNCSAVSTAKSFFFKETPVIWTMAVLAETLARQLTLFSASDLYPCTEDRHSLGSLRPLERKKKTWVKAVPVWPRREGGWQSLSTES